MLSCFFVLLFGVAGLAVVLFVVFVSVSFVFFAVGSAVCKCEIYIGVVVRVIYGCADGNELMVV